MKYPIDHVPIHDAAMLMPLMSESEYLAHREHIRENGLLEKLKFLDGKLLDGRHRLRVLAELGIPYEQYVEHLPSCMEPYSYVIGINANRRQLTPSQRAIVAARYMHVLTEQNKAKSKKNLKKGAFGCTISARSSLRIVRVARSYSYFTRWPIPACRKFAFCATDFTPIVT